MRKAGSRQSVSLSRIWLPSFYISLYHSISEQPLTCLILLIYVTANIPLEAMYSSVPCSPSAWARVEIIWLLVQLFGELFSWSYESDSASCYCKFPYGHDSLERPKTHHPQPAPVDVCGWFTHPKVCDIILPKCYPNVGRCTSCLLPFPVTKATWCASPTVLLCSAICCMFSGCWSTTHSTVSHRTAGNGAQLTDVMAL